MWHARGKKEMFTGYWFGGTNGKKTVGRPRRRWEDNIRMDPREIGIDGTMFINLAQDRIQWHACVNTVMNFRVP
jgi:hypothetical protein